MEQTLPTTQHYYRTRLFLFSLIVVVLGAVFAAAGVFALLPKELGQGYGAVISTLHGIDSMLMQKVAVIYIVIVIAIAVAMIVLHLFYSHRVAGPAFRLSREAIKIGEGNITGKIRFRQKDNLTDMADSLNSVADRHRERIEAVKGELSQIEAQSEALAILVQQGKNDPSLERTSESITANIKKIEKILSEIRA